MTHKKNLYIILSTYSIPPRMDDMQNDVLILSIKYGDEKDINISMARDDLNELEVQKEIKDRKLDIEIVQDDDVKFKVELYDYDGKIVFEATEWIGWAKLTKKKSTFTEVFRVIDGLSPREKKGINDVLETEELDLKLPSDSDDEKLEEAVEVMEDLEDEQEVDDQPVGIEYPDEHVGYAEYGMKEKYIRMKHKYLKLKRKFLKNIAKAL